MNPQCFEWRIPFSIARFCFYRVLTNLVICKTFKQKEKMRQAGRAAATVLHKLCALVEAGISTLDLDEAGGKLMKEVGVSSACRGYRAGSKIFPSYTCLSVNEEIVHGIGLPERKLALGDIISVDVCISCDGYIGDNCRTVPVGNVSPEVERLLKITEESLFLGIDQAVHKNRVGDVSRAVQNHVEGAGFAVITNFVGHGVGKTLHEDPQIPNYGQAGSGPRLKKGMAVCIEPMVNTKSSKVKMGEDGWTALAVDGMPSAHFEHTLLVDEERAEIITIPEGFEKAEPFFGTVAATV